MFETVRSIAISLAAWDLNEKPLLAQTKANVRADIVSKLLEKGYSPNVSNTLGITPLMYAAGNGNAMSVSILLAHGARPDACDVWGQNALHYAAAAKNSHFPTFAKRIYLNEKGGSHEVPQDADYEQCLLHLCEAAGANINARAQSGETPLMSALGVPGHVTVLIEHGADVSCKNSEGETALAVASRYDFKKTVTLLHQYAK